MVHLSDVQPVNFFSDRYQRSYSSPRIINQNSLPSFSLSFAVRFGCFIHLIKMNWFNLSKYPFVSFGENGLHVQVDEQDGKKILVY